MGAGRLRVAALLSQYCYVCLGGRCFSLRRFFLWSFVLCRLMASFQVLRFCLSPMAGYLGMAK
jgi:hypothetical protein